jgi:hypothetical protein
MDSLKNTGILNEQIRTTYSICLPGRTSNQPALIPDSVMFSAVSTSKMNELLKACDVSQFLADKVRIHSNHV